MKNKQIAVILLLFWVFISCEKTKKEIKTETVKTETKVVLDTVQISKTNNTSWDKNTTLAEGIIYRSGEENNWKSVIVTNIFGFKTNPTIGKMAQIIPLRNDLPIIELQIINTEKRNDVDEYDTSNDWFEVNLELIKNKNYWTAESPKDIRAEYPSDVFILYPPIKGAQLLDISKIDVSNLPKDVSKEIIKGALDFDGDSLPDALVLSFCCNNKTTKDDCEYECGETYIKVNNNWSLINSSQPL